MKRDDSDRKELAKNFADCPSHGDGHKDFISSGTPSILTGTRSGLLTNSMRDEPQHAVALDHCERMMRRDSELDNTTQISINNLPLDIHKSPQPKRPTPTGRIAAIEHAIRAQNWDEALRLVSREDSGNEI